MSLDDPVPFETHLDLDRGRLTMVVRGVWTTRQLVTFQNHMAEIEARFVASGRAPESLITLVDLREGGIQSQEVASVIRSDVMRYQQMSRHIAVVVSGSALQRMQTRRMAPQSKHRFFTDYGCAVQWLDQCARRTHANTASYWAAA